MGRWSGGILLTATTSEESQTSENSRSSRSICDELRLDSVHTGDQKGRGNNSSADVETIDSKQCQQWTRAANHVNLGEYKIYLMAAYSELSREEKEEVKKRRRRKESESWRKSREDPPFFPPNGNSLLFGIPRVVSFLIFLILFILFHLVLLFSLIIFCYTFA